MKTRTRRTTPIERKKKKQALKWPTQILRILDSLYFKRQRRKTKQMHLCEQCDKTLKKKTKKFDER